MSLARSPSTSRRLLLGLLVFAVFLIFDIALFGWLIFRSLSEREVEKILIETEGEMQTLAAKIAERVHEEGTDLYTAVAVETETLTYIDSMLQEQEIVTTIEIRSSNGMLVWRSDNQETRPSLAGQPLFEDTENAIRFPDPELGADVDSVTVSDREGKVEQVHRREVSEELRDLEVPIRDLGSIQIGISQQELESRAEILRQDLIRQVSVIGSVTLLLFIIAYLGIWFLVRRSRRLEEQAKEAEQMAYIGTLASGLAHEIRNPLNSLNLNMQLLQEEMGDRDSTPSGPRLLGITRSEISRLERLVTDFLSYAKPRPLELEEVSAGELLEMTEAMATAEIRSRGARFEAEDRSGGVRFQIDPAQVRQLLLNLVHNALASTEESGRTPRVRVVAERQGQRLVFSVRDNGVGISPEEQGKIFDLFYSTRRGGTGLGLSIVQRIVRDHGGNISIDSTPGEGSTVRVTLPLVFGTEATVPQAIERTA